MLILLVSVKRDLGLTLEGVSLIANVELASADEDVLSSQIKFWSISFEGSATINLDVPVYRALLKIIEDIHSGRHLNIFALLGEDTTGPGLRIAPQAKRPSYVNLGNRWET